jgi:hypothetical protein
MAISKISNSVFSKGMPKKYAFWDGESAENFGSVDYLVIAGGGAGAGAFASGGGGAGGYLTGTLSVKKTRYVITVGAGGTPPANGNDSEFSTIRCAGGGGNWSSFGHPGPGGGSSGGVPIGSRRFAKTSPVVSGQGNKGGTTNGVYGGDYGGSGGGGAGAAGVNATGGFASAGGAGAASSITGTSVTRAGGGGGGIAAGTGTTGAGGSGGGGIGAKSTDGATRVNNGGNGIANTGSGGGAGAAYGGAGSGGSGVVIISYADSLPEARLTTGSPTYTTTGGKRIYVFNGSGSITF